jgi:antitoxin (DNA-binding transcriptional repressor) of toxin-antitoxin stability system
LQTDPKAIEDDLASHPGEPVIVTRGGRPIFAIVPVDEERLYDHLLATAPPYLRMMREAEEAVAAGETRPFSELLAD